MWHKETGAAVERLTGHSPRSNSIVWNPVDPVMLASCGDDGKVKMYVVSMAPSTSPQLPPCCFKELHHRQLTMAQLVKQSQGPRAADHVQAMETAE